ncbi:hypothetical protein SAMN05444156_1743 [Verrucomicrobium sp. GAS474]|uniref:SecDF P1 head subdomain-containing protein n=1 Tax=Verrucomicrobium sp. GAS474 TaxID=1882831 RepID=UPI00087C41C0|nr:hypothetical protein [Verrucomicrobium sp. GAS474]SDU06257.1 hypothetical protein SAMN05444156_1743 [Verrucomicrobium sp. GAS474]
MKRAHLILVFALALMATYDPAMAQADLPTLSITREDVTKVVIEIDPKQPEGILTMTLTPAKQADLAKITRENSGKRIRFIIDGKVASEPTVNSPITGKRSR